MPGYKPIEERFWSKVKKTETCWLWTDRLAKGYGRIGLSRTSQMKQAHVFSWELHFGPITGDRCVLHKCDVKNCVRPDHLFLGTRIDNWKDRDAKGRTAKGEQIGNSKFTAEIVASVRASYASGIKQSVLADQFGISRQHIHQIVHNSRWKHLVVGVPPNKW